MAQRSPLPTNIPGCRQILGGTHARKRRADSRCRNSLAQFFLSAGGSIRVSAVVLRVCDDSGLPRYPGSGEYWRLRGGKPILQELLSLLYTAWNQPEDSMVSQRLSGWRAAFSEFGRGPPGAIQIQLEKSGYPGSSLGRNPVTARPIVHQSVPSGKSDASGSRRNEKLFAELLSR